MLQWSRSPGGTVVVGCPASDAFRAFTATDTIHFARTWVEVPVNDEERAAFRTWPGGAAVPRHKPAYTRLWATEDGAIWTRTTRPSELTANSEELQSMGAGTHTWQYHLPTDGMDVFESDGRWRGHVRTPPNWVAEPFPGLADPFIRGDTVWAVTSGELGEWYVSKFVVDWER